MTKSPRDTNLQLTGQKIQLKSAETNGCEERTAWAALRAVHQMGDEISECMKLVHLYTTTRTYFQTGGTNQGTFIKPITPKPSQKK